MYAAALNHYGVYLEDVFGDILSHVNKVEADSNLEATERSRLVSARLGQGLFRIGVIDKWKVCSVTGFTDTALLIAAHVKPWAFSSNRERLDPDNGLLLVPNVDKAFDLGYISFNDSGSIIMSSHCSDYDMLGITSNMSLIVDDRLAPYLEFHRTQIFKN